MNLSEPAPPVGCSAHSAPYTVQELFDVQNKPMEEQEGNRYKALKVIDNEMKVLPYRLYLMNSRVLRLH